MSKAQFIKDYLTDEQLPRLEIIMKVFKNAKVEGKNGQRFKSTEGTDVSNESVNGKT